MDNQTNRAGLELSGMMPFSPEAEQSVLGAVLLDSSCMDRVAEILPRPEYFHQMNNALIYRVMMELFTEGKPVDFVVVLEKLKESGQFDEATGKTYLMQLAQLVPSISNVETYAKIVRDKYDIRSLMIAAREILDEAGDGSVDAALLLDSAEQKIFDIRRGKNMQGLQHVHELVVENIDRLDLLNSGDESLKAIPTGIKLLDQCITGLNRSDLILLAARPGMGKTSFALNIMRNVAVQSKKRVAFFSLEMSKEQLCSRLLSTEGMISGTKLRTGKLDDNEWVRLIEAGDVLSKTEMYFDDNPNITVPEIKSDNRVQVISEITRNLKIMAKELNVPVITLSQLSRATEKRGNDQRRPMLSDLRDSGSIEQDADIVLFLYREDYYSSVDGPSEEVDKNKGECIVAKNRHGESKSIPLHWQGEFMRFTSQEVIHSAPY